MVVKLVYNTVIQINGENPNSKWWCKKIKMAVLTPNGSATNSVLGTPNSGKTDKKGGNTAKKYLHSNALRESGRN